MRRRGPHYFLCNPACPVRPSDLRRHVPTRGVILRGPLGVRGPAADPGQSGASMKLTERKIEKLATEHGRKDRLTFDDAQRGLACA